MSPSASPEAHPVSPSMGVLIPPLPRLPTVPMERDTAQPSYTYAPPMGELSSPDSTPGPVEVAYVEYTYGPGYSWLQSDMRSNQPQAQSMYAPHGPVFRERVATGYTYHA